MDSRAGRVGNWVKQYSQSQQLSNRATGFEFVWLDISQF